ncbi:hypothetical protein [Blautia sp.]|uniref:hypothetical protein n=1 Tax=Blautia sp. TaxID=1955243 RepID=UPI0039956CE0
MEFPVITEEERRRLLAPPSGKVEMVLDTDTYNEVDDQFALAYALMSPEKLDLKAVYAAPFSSEFFDRQLKSKKERVTVPMTSDLKEGLELSYKEIIKIFNMLDRSPDGRVFRGSAEYMKERGACGIRCRKRSCQGPWKAKIFFMSCNWEITNIARQF